MVHLKCIKRGLDFEHGAHYIEGQVMSSVLKMDTRGDFAGVCSRGSRLPVSTILLAGPSASGTGLSLISGAVGGKKRFEFEDFPDTT